MQSRIAIVAFASYPTEPRTRRETEALADTGYLVDVISPKRPGEAAYELLNGVNVYRLPVVKTRTSKLSYVWEYSWFGLLAFFTLSWLYMRRRYKIVHVHNIPEILVFTAIIPKLFGSKIILDMHDPMPEVFVTKYQVPASHPAIVFIEFLESLSISFADKVLVPNKACQKLFAKRGSDTDKLQVLLNSADERIFKLHKPSIRPISTERFSLIYHGTITERSGLDTALYAIALLKDRIPSLKLHVYGDGDYVGEFLGLRSNLGLSDSVFYHGYATLETIAAALDKANLGIIPYKRNPFADIATPTRIFECLRMGVPAIAPRLAGVLDYFDEESLFLFEPGDANDLARMIERVYADPEWCMSVLEHGIVKCGAYWWESERHTLLQIYEGFTSALQSRFSS